MNKKWLAVSFVYSWAVPMCAILSLPSFPGQVDVGMAFGSWMSLQLVLAYEGAWIKVLLLSTFMGATVFALGMGEVVLGRYLMGLTLIVLSLIFLAGGDSAENNSGPKTTP